MHFQVDSKHHSHKNCSFDNSFHLVSLNELIKIRTVFCHFASVYSLTHTILYLCLELSVYLCSDLSVYANIII